MATKTGFQKLADAMNYELPTIGTPARTQQRNIPSNVPEAKKEGSQEAPAVQHAPAAPAANKEVVILNFQISRDAKNKIEKIKQLTYRSSMKDVVVEALNDLFQKYGIQ